MRLKPLLLFLLPLTLTAQQQTIRTDSTLVLVPTLVHATSNDLAYGLAATDFALTDNNLPQRVTLDAGLEQPLALVVLMQTGASAPSHFDALRNLDTMLDNLVGTGKAPHEVALVAFDSQPRTLCPFVPDLDSLPGSLIQPEPGDDGAAIYDALDYALRLLQQQPANTRRAILLLSQTHDDGSKTPIAQIVRTVAETNTAIYSLTFSPEKKQLKDALLFKQKVPGNKPIDLGNGTFVAYFDLAAPLRLAYGAMQNNAAAAAATLSGGESLDFTDRHSLENDLGTLANHLANRYTLSFSPTANQPGLHSLAVSLPTHPEMTVQARNNYWATGSK